MKTILLPTDFSESSFNAACYAASLSNQVHVSTLILYHSNTFPSSATELSMLHEHTLEILASFKQRIQPYIHGGTQIDVRTDEFPLSVAIELITEKQKVDLIVMATSGKNDLERTIVGSNTLNVARECTAPLLLVPKEAKFEGINKLLFAADLKNVNQTTPTDALKKIIQLFKAHLVVVNVLNSGSETDLNLEQAALQRLLEPEQAEYHYIDTKHLVGGIMEFAVSHQIQLVAIVPKKHGFLEGLFHRSMTSEFAYHTYLPLLILK